MAKTMIGRDRSVGGGVLKGGAMLRVRLIRIKEENKLDN
jgi:hypothetical protein